MATSQPPVAPAAPAKASLMEDFVDIFTSPAEVFQRRAGSNAWIVLIVIMVLCLVLFLATRGLLSPIFDAEYARATVKAMAKNPQVTADQMAQGKGLFQTIFVVIVFLAPLLSAVVMGAVLWLTGKFVVGAKQS